MQKATLVLEDGTILEGKAFGAETDAVFELVFNTSMTGYQEIITDPSYKGQGVLFTVSHIGNVGINPEDYESDHPQVSAVVTRSLSRTVSNWRASGSLPLWMAEHGVPGISGVDTRYLTRKLRDEGTMKAALSTKGTDAETLLEMARSWSGLDGLDMVKEVTCTEPYEWENDAAQSWLEPSTLNLQPSHVVLYDFGSKYNIIRHLVARGAKVTVVPAATSAEDALVLNPDGILLSNGPGDPAGVGYAITAATKLISRSVPILGICLGHQIMGLALGGETARLKFGHHGGNHPVKDLQSGHVLITSQNHNYFVEIESLDTDEVEITHLSLNDKSLEGMRLRHKPALSVQFHPEASPGPHDATGVFDAFFELMEGATHA